MQTTWLPDWMDTTTFYSEGHRVSKLEVEYSVCCKFTISIFSLQ